MTSSHIKKVASPNPSWKPGDTIVSPVQATVALDPKDISQQDMYKLLIGSIVPRPIAFVSSIGKDGSRNLSPFSFFNGVSSKPPCLVVAVSGKPSGENKDTLRNILETKEFVVNTVSQWIAEPMVHTAAEYPYGVDEMEKVGLTPIPSVKVKPPRVKESPVQFECKVYGTHQIGEGGAGSTTLIIGEIVFIHIFDKAYQNGRVLLDEIKPVGRLGGFGYSAVTEMFEIPVPKAGS